MADKTYVIISWPASEGYLKDPASTTGPALKYAAVVQKGVNARFHGPEEGGSRIGVVVVWDNQEDHTTFMANAMGPGSKMRQLIGPLRGAQGGQVKTIVTFAEDPFPAFQAPVTEIAISTLKPGADLEFVSESLGEIVSEANTADSPALGAALGSAVDDSDSDKLVLVTGWNSMEDYRQAVEEHAKPILQEISSQVTLDQHHYRLAQVYT